MEYRSANKCKASGSRYIYRSKDLLQKGESSAPGINEFLYTLSKVIVDTKRKGCDFILYNYIML